MQHFGQVFLAFALFITSPFVIQLFSLLPFELHTWKVLCHTLTSVGGPLRTQQGPLQEGEWIRVYQLPLDVIPFAVTLGKFFRLYGLVMQE
jgi:hypothetical protein